MTYVLILTMITIGQWGQIEPRSRLLTFEDKEACEAAAEKADKEYKEHWADIANGKSNVCIELTNVPEHLFRVVD